MKKTLIILAFITLILGSDPTVARADSLEWVKNKYGIHILNSRSDIITASHLLNSNGGDWSWITTVIRKDESNLDHWQDFFDTCREYHLIPIVRIATQIENNHWQKPTEQDLYYFANFLDNLNWPIKTRFVIIFNEPNRGDEWGQKADPKEYANILYLAGKIFKEKNENFWLISAGLDLATPHKPPEYYSAENFYYQMINHNPKVFDNIDSLGSHSYPNHGFVGKPSNTGKTSIKGYIWEIDYLKKLGVQKNLTVFLTETGWPHQEGVQLLKKFYHSEELSKFFEQAFDSWEKDPNLIAFTPFILNYPDPPFDHFSWQKANGDFYPYVNSLQQRVKNANYPPQIDKAKIKKVVFPFIILPNHQYTGKIQILNRGQKIWGENNIQYCFNPLSHSKISLTPLCQIETKLVRPNETDWFEFRFILEEQETEKTEFGWENLDKLEIKPIITPKTHLYRQKTGFWEKISPLFTNLSRIKIPQFLKL